MKITLKPLGDVAKEIMAELRDRIDGVFNCPVEIKAGFSSLSHAYDQKREQYLSSKLIASLNSSGRERDEKIVGITEVDIYAPGLNFVFGEADVASGIAIVSLRRLRQEYYGLSPEKNLFLERATKEIVHELGHTFGLGHCADVRCVMHFSNGLADTDLKGMAFCEKCCPRLV
ncbi:MAG: archaemetzincin family Zn-dependent metalloprotease [Dehalococcoidia bacterium]|nr:archaemetzincin family Zn-dependent metalloprotease [Dehalococcoidia bacterium]